VSALAQNSVVRGACPHDCPDTCALLTTVENGVATAVKGDPDHPTTHGALCAKVSKYTERTYHAERLLHPLKRVGPKGSGQFTRVSWDEALDGIAARLGDISSRDPQAILPYSYAGTMGLLQSESMAARFFHKLGASFLDRTICASAGTEALINTIGAKLGMHVENFEHSELIVIWGSNSITSNLHFWTFAQRAKRNGAKLICIDPWKNDTAAKCHEHIALMPGTDAALAYGVMHELIRSGQLDHDYIAQHTLGFAELRERALTYTPERVAQICGISADQVRSLARDYGATKKSAIRVNYGLQRIRGGGNAVRAITYLPALTGAWRESSGGMLLSSSGAHPVDNAYLQRPDLLGARRPRTLNMSTIGDDLQRESSPAFGPKIEALVVYNSNPVAVAPESQAVAKGFAREDLFTVVLEHFMTDTADYADYVLPATTQLEHLDVHKAYGHVYFLANNPAIAPLGESKANTQIFRELAARMGFEEACFAESDDEMAERTILTSDPRAAGISWDRLKAQGWARLSVADAPFAAGNFPTPSGKCEFVSERLAAIGLDPLAEVLLPYESQASSADLARRFPLAMISPPVRNFLNSTFVNVASLRASDEEPSLEINPQDALVRGIQGGERIRVFNDRGEYHCIARVSERPRSGVVVGTGIWWRKFGLNQTNVNELTHQKLTDLGRAPCFYDCLVEIAPMGSAAA
jgi:anaerobic selenocysteine-containing dehydrogenase